MSLGEFLDELTDNKRLQAALSYSFGDYGEFLSSISKSKISIDFR